MPVFILTGVTHSFNVRNGSKIDSIPSYVKYLSKHIVVVCHDNVVAESFFATVRNVAFNFGLAQSSNGICLYRNIR